MVLLLRFLVDLTAAPPPPSAVRDTHLLTPWVLLFTPDELQDEERDFQGISSLAGAPGGRLWATWYGGGEGEDAGNVVMLATSADGGDTWSEVRYVISAQGNVRCFDPEIWLDPQQRMWVFWGQAYSPGIAAHTWAMVTENPDAEYPVWQRPVRIAPGVMMNKPTVLASGDWVLPISDWEGRRRKIEGEATAGMVVSRDAGKSFEFVGAVHTPVADRSFDEHSIVEREDGSLWMWLRTNYGIGQAKSTDGGATWTESYPLDLPHPTARFFLSRLASGRLLLVKHGPLEGEFRERSHLTAYLSEDDGQTWQGGLLLDERTGVSYPDGFQDAAGVIYVTYDYDRYGQKEILMSRFTETDVLAGKPVSQTFVTRQLINKAGTLE